MCDSISTFDDTFTIQSDPDSVRDAYPGFAAPHPVAGALLASVGMPDHMSGRFSPPRTCIDSAIADAIRR